MVVLLGKSLAVIILLCALSACSFHVGIDYTGKSGQSNTTETPGFRQNRGN